MSQFENRSDLRGLLAGPTRLVRIGSVARVGWRRVPRATRKAMTTWSPPPPRNTRVSCRLNNSRHRLTASM